MERRFNGTIATDGKFITGLALRFNAPYKLEGTDYWEDIAPDVFDEYLSRNHDVVALYNHDVNKLLGRVAAGTLVLRKTTEGIEYSIPYNAEDEDHRYVMNKLKTGNVNGSSWSFMPSKITMRSEGDKRIARIEAISAFVDVGPVVLPANKNTTAQARSISDEHYEQIQKAEARAKTLALKERITKMK